MPFVFAKTDSTTAPIAAKRASFTSQTKMHTEPTKTELKVTSDPRLRAGVRAALEHICEQHGLAKEEQRELASAVEKECAKEFASQCGPVCAVTIDETGERIEVHVAPIKDSNVVEMSSRETNVPAAGERRRAAPSTRHASAAHTKSNGAPVFVKYFHRNPTHS
jgi:hypothetical protein